MAISKTFKGAVAWILFCCVSLASSTVHANEHPEVSAETLPSLAVNAKSALLMEPVTGQILLEQNAHEPLPPASVTKVMTMLLIFEALDQGKIDWNESVTCSEHAASMGGSQIYLEAMEQQSVRDLVKAIVISSGNDAAVAMAEFIAGSEDGFVTMMNTRAKELGMSNTFFKNASGLHEDGHVTSAYDIALMSRELINRHPVVFEYSTIWMDKITHKTARGIEEFGLSNTNRLLKSYPATTGLKTGSTSQALYCISATAEKNGLHLNAIILGAPDPNTRFGEAIKMMDYGFANYAMAKGDPADTLIGELPVIKGEKEQVQVKVKNQVHALIPKGKSIELEKNIEAVTAVKAPFDKDTNAGEIVYLYEGREVGRSELVTAEAMQRASLPEIMIRVLIGWFK